MRISLCWRMLKIPAMHAVDPPWMGFGDHHGGGWESTGDEKFMDDPRVAGSGNGETIRPGAGSPWATRRGGGPHFGVRSG